MTINLHEHYDILPCTLEKYLVKGAKKSILVLPGGGYAHVSPREGKPVAEAFNAAGYNAFVLTYSVKGQKDVDDSDIKFPAQLLQTAAAINYIRENSKNWKISKKVAVCGFSAGGHLAASISTLYNRPYVLHTLALTARQVRPDAAILCYPVISSTIKSHSASIKNLIGDDQSLIREVSLEKQVKKTTPPTFVWHTADDGVVNVANALNYAVALSKKEVPFELHVFTHGQHGLSLCSEVTDMVNPHCAVWFDIAVSWLGSIL